MNNPDEPFKILVVDDNPKNLQLLGDILHQEKYKVDFALSGEKAVESLDRKDYDLFLLDIMMPGMSGFDLCKKIRKIKKFDDSSVIFLTARTDKESLVQGFSIGAQDYITKPFDLQELLSRVKSHLEIKYSRDKLKKVNEWLEQEVNKRTIELKEANDKLKDANEKLLMLKDQLVEENLSLKSEIKLEHQFDEIIGNSKEIKKLLNLVEEVAPTDTTVLIEGETGVGKELIARAIHYTSSRKDLPMTKLNCAALPPTLIESELFGYEKGAFTGAVKTQAGRFEIADKGTIFLDEIGELPLELQVKLLRVLQEGEFERLGSAVTRKTDVRVITATNRQLKKEIKEGRFREDLFYRLSVFPLFVPPLRERIDDIPLLVTHFVNKFSKKVNKQIQKIPQNTLSLMMKYSWPGNVRELENVVERAMIMSKGSTLKLAEPLRDKGDDLNLASGRLTLNEMEKKYIIEVLEETYWKVEGKNGAAIILDMHPETLRSRMRKLGIKRPNPNT